MYSNTLLPKSVTPFSIKKNSKSCIVLIHGIQDYPGEFREMAQLLSDSGSIDVVVPRLAGHGTDQNDLISTTYNDWIRSVEEYLLNIQHKYNKIFLAGHSMGALIAIHLATKFFIEGLIVISPPLKVKNKMIYLTPIMRFFIKRLKENGTHKARTEDEKRIEEIYWDWIYIKPTYQLLKLIKKCRRILKKIETPILIFASEKDGTVPHSVAEYLENRVKSNDIKKVILKESRHMVTRSSDLNLIVNKMAQWINR